METPSIEVTITWEYNIPARGDLSATPPAPRATATIPGAKSEIITAVAQQLRESAKQEDANTSNWFHALADLLDASTVEKAPDRVAQPREMATPMTRTPSMCTTYPGDGPRY